MKKETPISEITSIEREIADVENELLVMEHCLRNGMDYDDASDYSRAAIAVGKAAAVRAAHGSTGMEAESLYSNLLDSSAPSCYNRDIRERLTSCRERLDNISNYNWFVDKLKNLGKDIVQNLKEGGKERIRQFIDKRRRAEVLRDEEAIKGSMEKVRIIIQDLTTGEYKKSRWYDAPAATCPNPWSDTSVTLLNPIKFYGYCKPVRECILYHEYQHHHQYKMWRQRNPQAPVGRFLKEIVPNELQAYKATLLCLDARLKEIELLRRKGEI